MNYWPWPASTQFRKSEDEILKFLYFLLKGSAIYRRRLLGKLFDIQLISNKKTLKIWSKKYEQKTLIYFFITGLLFMISHFSVPIS